MAYLDYFPHHVTLWYSHGPVCGWTNVAAARAESARAGAGGAIAHAATALAATLQAASAAYATTDEEQRDILGEQMQL
ncbi:type VII secretion target [Mycobacterium sp. Aquia_216]|uniref:type VII secretion target n=1 Tax=Mycobacterium sp. Aquia_216 TaxID=2991729 RepID=UPI00227B4581|nr:type VII secretion target [Mycobacterium sp. Aquia_216]WAJ45418.1 type VII secretion target [Mycobacterium sp. Aquia_216]